MSNPELRTSYPASLARLALRAQARELCRQGGTICQAIPKLLGMIECLIERLSEECDMSHLAAGTHLTLAVEMEYRTRNIQQGSTVCALLHKNCSIVANEIHHDGGAQKTHFTKRHPADGTNLLLKLGHAAGIERVTA
jgi:hypothetical protein